MRSIITFIRRRGGLNSPSAQNAVEVLASVPPQQLYTGTADCDYCLDTRETTSPSACGAYASPSITRRKLNDIQPHLVQTETHQPDDDGFLIG